MFNRSTFARLAIIFSLFSCTSHPSPKEAEVSEKEVSTTISPDKVETIKSDFGAAKKIDLQAELLNEYGDHLVTLHDSTLDLVDPGGLHDPFFSFDTASLKRALHGFEMKTPADEEEAYVFSKGNSKIKVQFWEVEERSAEYTELSGVYVIGTVYERDILFSSGIKIGMPAEVLFAKFFDNYEEVINGVKILAAWEDERGNSVTVYYFKDGLLTAIEFGNNSL